MAGRIILGTANPSLGSNGKIAAGSTLTFYQNLTTTPATVYNAIDLLTPLANPLTCDASGEFPQVWAPSLTAYSVKWSRPGLSDITYDNIFVTSDVGQALNYGPEVNVTAAATTNLNASTANLQAVLGNTTITSFGPGVFLYRILRFTGTPIITHNAATLVLLGGVNRQVVAGDVGIYVSDGSGNWREVSYQRNARIPVQAAGGSTGTSTIASSGTLNLVTPQNTQGLILIEDLGANGGGMTTLSYYNNGNIVGIVNLGRATSGGSGNLASITTNKPTADSFVVITANANGGSPTSIAYSFISYPD